MSVSTGSGFLAGAGLDLVEACPVEEEDLLFMVRELLPAGFEELALDEERLDPP